MASAAATTTSDRFSTSMTLRCPICRTCIDRRWTPSSCLTLRRLLQRVFPVEYAARAAEEEEQHNSALPRLPHALGDGQKILPLFVLDSLLPGQRMFLHVFEVRYRLLIQRAMSNHNRHFGMVGRSSTGASPSNNSDGVANHGTEVEILSCVESPDGRFRVAVQGRSIFRIINKDLCDGYWEAIVEDVSIDSSVDDEIDDTNESNMDTTARQEHSARRGDANITSTTAENAHIPDDDDVEDENDDGDSNMMDGCDLAEHVIRLFQQWEEYIVQNRWERHTNQLQDVKSILGTMPSAQEQRRLAIWVAAAINPLPPLGVAREIRPAVLAVARYPTRQLQIVKKALDESIQLVQHKRGTIHVFGSGRVDVELGMRIILCLVAWWFLQGYIQGVVLEKFGLQPTLLGIFGVFESSRNGDQSSSSEL